MSLKLINAVIPARGGSKSIKKKNIALVGSHPLIAYTIQACKESKNINRIIVSTEDQEIAEIAKDYGAEVPFKRPEEFSKDDSTDMGFLNNYFDNVAGDEVCLMRPTTPFRSPDFIDKTIELYFLNREKITGLRSVCVTEETPYKVFTLIDNYCCGFFDNFKGIKDYSNLPRQTFPKTYQANGHIDIVKKETLKKGSVFGDKTYSSICEKTVDIDSEFELLLVNRLVGTKLDVLTSGITKGKK